MLLLLNQVRITFKKVYYVMRCSPYLYFVLEINPRFYFEILVSLHSFVKIASTIFIHS